MIILHYFKMALVGCVCVAAASCTSPTKEMAKQAAIVVEVSQESKMRLVKSTELIEETKASLVKADASLSEIIVDASSPVDATSNEIIVDAYHKLLTKIIERVGVAEIEIANAVAKLGEIETLTYECVIDQGVIYEAGKTIQELIPRVKDKTPWWAMLMGNGFLALIVVGVVLVLWNTGIGTFFKRILWGAGRMLPQYAIDHAEIDLDSSLNQSERIEKRKSGDHAYRCAHEKLQKKGK